MFITNLIAIALAGAITFLLLGFRPGAHGLRDVHLRRGLTTAVILFVDRLSAEIGRPVTVRVVQFTLVESSP